MNKKGFIMFAVVTAIVAIVTILKVYYERCPKLSPLVVENIEAIANEEADPNVSYGYGLKSCYENGRLVGETCQQTYPQDECSLHREWGTCPN